MPFENRYPEITVNSNESNLKIIPLLPNNKIAGSQYLTIIKFQCKIRTDKAVLQRILISFAIKNRLQDAQNS